MKTTGKRQNLQAPAWFLAFEKRNNARFERIEKRLDKIEADINNIVTKNNLKR
jgi:hypothetical protein